MKNKPKKITLFGIAVIGLIVGLLLGVVRECVPLDDDAAMLDFKKHLANFVESEKPEMPVAKVLAPMEAVQICMRHSRAYETEASEISYYFPTTKIDMQDGKGAPSDSVRRIKTERLAIRVNGKDYRLDFEKSEGHRQNRCFDFDKAVFRIVDNSGKPSLLLTE